MNVRDKTVIVTGSGGDGSGRATARRFAREGASVIVDDIDESGARETLRLIEAEGGRAAVSVTDVRSEAAVREMIQSAERSFGPLAVLVNNAGPGYHPGEPLEHWRDMIETDLLGTAYVTRYGIDAMRRHGGGGAIVDLSAALRRGRCERRAGVRCVEGGHHAADGGTRRARENGWH
jgi:NAD(P)-dependent dehydrogenase (short-subunit alcohol dehydrogenase family)